MTDRIITHAGLLQIHQALHITVPLEQLSPLLVMTLTNVACHWKNKTLTTDLKVEQRANDFRKLMK